MIIQELISTYVMPPRLTAELYQALGGIPGVTVDPGAVDVAGRQGIGFLHGSGPAGGVTEIILDPHTYHLMGYELRLLPKYGSRLVSGTAYLQMALVRGPGVMP